MKSGSPVPYESQAEPGVLCAVPNEDNHVTHLTSEGTEAREGGSFAQAYWDSSFRSEWP